MLQNFIRNKNKQASQKLFYSTSRIAFPVEFLKVLWSSLDIFYIFLYVCKFDCSVSRWHYAANE